MNRFALLALASVLVALPMSGCVNREAQKQAKRTEALVSDTTIPVTTQPAGTMTMIEALEITGGIVTGDDTQVGAKNGGRLTAVYVNDGDPVRAGQVIATQETQDLMTRLRQAQAQVDAARSQVRQAQQDAVVGPQRSSAAVRAAQARLAQAQQSLTKLQRGDREEQRRQVQAQVNSAKSNMTTAKTDLDRAKSLFEAGAISRQEVDRAANAYAAALSQYESTLEQQRIQQTGARPEDLAMARQEVLQAQEALNNERAAKQLDVQFKNRIEAAQANLQAALENAQLVRQSLEDATIRSPFTGTVSGRPAQVGTMLAPGSPVARVVAVGGAYFEGDIPETQVRSVTPGRMVQVTIDALSNDKTMGKVVAVNPMGTSVGRMFKARIQLVSPPANLRPGMFARGQVELRSVPGAITVPSSAVVRQGGEAFLFLLEGNKAKRVKVETGLQQDQVTQVIGIDPGAEVIVSGQTKLVDGSAVKVEKPTTASADKPASGG